MKIEELIEGTAKCLRDQSLSGATAAAQVLEDALKCGRAENMTGEALRELLVSEIQQTTDWLAVALRTIRRASLSEPLKHEHVLGDVTGCAKCSGSGILSKER